MIWMPRLRADSRNGAIFDTKLLTRSVAPLHRCLAHMSQIRTAVSGIGRDCSRLTERHSPLPLNASTRERRLTVRSAAPTGGNASASRRTRSQREGSIAKHAITTAVEQL